MFGVSQKYSVCVIDIGSPRLGRLGWCLMGAEGGDPLVGVNLDDLVPVLASQLETSGVLLGFEAPLCVPLRQDLMLSLKARKGEARRPWSAGAGAQVLAMNLPIMTYLLKELSRLSQNLNVFLNETDFQANPKEVMIFEALVSGVDKGASHIEDAEIMAAYCMKFAQQLKLPPSILEEEDGTDFLNLAAASLLRCGLIDQIEALNLFSPIYKPSGAISANAVYLKAPT